MRPVTVNGRALAASKRITLERSALSEPYSDFLRRAPGRFGTPLEIFIFSGRSISKSDTLGFRKGRLPSERSERRLAVDGVGEPSTRGCICSSRSIASGSRRRVKKWGFEGWMDLYLPAGISQWPKRATSGVRDPVVKDDIEPVTRRQRVLIQTKKGLESTARYLRFRFRSSVEFPQLGFVFDRTFATDLIWKQMS
jgi:hypothetical protein